MNERSWPEALTPKCQWRASVVFHLSAPLLQAKVLTKFMMDTMSISRLLTSEKNPRMNGFILQFGQLFTHVTMSDLFDIWYIHTYTYISLGEIALLII